MAITGGMAYIVLFAVFQSIWLVTNCQEEKDLIGTVYVSEVFAGSRADIQRKISLIRMKEPTNQASITKCIGTLELSNNFDVLKMNEQLKTKIDSLESLPNDQCGHQFAEIIQKAIYEDIPQEHSNWIVIPWGFSRFFTHFGTVIAAHMDVLRDADIASLLQEYEYWSLDIMEFLAKNDHVKSTALAHYDGNVEQYAIEMLTLDHTINIWVPLEPVQDWPLAFIPADQCDETRTIISPFNDDRMQFIQHLLMSKTTKYDWYTRYNMQPDEVYVWDSRTVAHTAVKRGDGTGERSAISCVLMIVHQNEELLPPITSPPADFLCYTERVLKIMTKSHGSTAESLLAYMGYHRLCDDPPTAQPPSLSNSRLREFVLSKIVGKG
uniref:TauD/TfdA-like domain-containing protein n=1 Tax=Spongospora subterranea TaxID=70186 RepID=A0A0H5R090_9EUKA|eukprot:CRZ07391.1 hypothetical protein [Spongospora subterranea]